ncbi:Protein of unknown function [Pedobacter westerhofensis]|uniref:DUF3800 domain-containing protein n=1 Tax=Pedobacter westerhofensis TaxID=425512 RepID=A0A521B5T6_9SPHI|nr:DUF3800 domain-containing protein [Pedobacter westerhofensis]SMO42464.1 Protein of unknown function [Pedobacter westerhofensis]
MYFLYVDESGDAGKFDSSNLTKTGSPYLIYTGLVVHDAQWNQTLNTIKNFRKKIAKESFVSYNQEFHCAEMIDPRKIGAFTQISVPDRWKLIEEYCDLIGKVVKSSIIAAVLNKETSLLKPEEYTIAMITKLYQSFNHFLLQKKERGLVFFDRANERKISSHVRKLLGTNVTDRPLEIEQIDCILEDPVYKASSDSMLIQSADVVAYTVKEKEFPRAARKKFDADLIFDRKLLANCYNSHVSDNDGIIRR